MKNFKTKIIALVMVFALLIPTVAYAAPMVLLGNSPEDKILYSLFKHNSNGKFDATIKLKGQANEDFFVQQGVSQDELNQIKFMNDILKNMALQYDFIGGIDGRGLSFDGKMGIDYKEKNCINGRFTFNPKNIGFEFKQLYDKPFIIKFSDMIQRDIDVDIDKIDFVSYYKLLSSKDEYSRAVEKNYKQYYYILRNALKGKVSDLGEETLNIKKTNLSRKIKVQNYEINLKLNEIVDTYIKILEVMKNDENVRKLIQHRLIQVNNMITVKKDYEVFHLSKVEYEEAFKEIYEATSKEKWETLFEEIIQALSNEDVRMELLNNTELANLDYRIQLSLDKKNQMRRLVYKLDYDFMNFEESITFNRMGDEIQLSSIKAPKEALDLMDLQYDYEKTAELTPVILKNLKKNVIDQEGVTMLIDDIKKGSEVLGESDSNDIKEMIDDLLRKLDQTIKMFESQQNQ